jgi:hypothetical protein
MTATTRIISLFSTVAVVATGQVATNAPRPARRFVLPPPFARGTLSQLNLAAKQLTLATDDGPQTFSFANTTYLFRGKQKITPDQLKSNELVRLNYYTNDLQQLAIRRLKVDPLESPATKP